MNGEKTKLWNYHMGPFIKDVINQGGGGFAKRWVYLISLFSDSDDEGRRGQKPLKIHQNPGNIVNKLYK